MGSWRTAAERETRADRYVAVQKQQEQAKSPLSLVDHVLLYLSLPAFLLPLGRVNGDRSWLRFSRLKSKEGFGNVYTIMMASSSPPLTGNVFFRLCPMLSTQCQSGE